MTIPLFLALLLPLQALGILLLKAGMDQEARRSEQACATRRRQADIFLAKRLNKRKGLPGGKVPYFIEDEEES